MANLARLARPELVALLRHHMYSGLTFAPGAPEGLERTWFALHPETEAHVAATLNGGAIAVTTLRRRMVGALDIVATLVADQGVPGHLELKSIRSETLRLRVQECSPEELSICLGVAQSVVTRGVTDAAHKRSWARQQLGLAGLILVRAELFGTPVDGAAADLSASQRWRAKHAAWAVLRESAPWLPWQHSDGQLSPLERLLQAAWHASIAARTSTPDLRFRIAALTTAIAAWPDGQLLPAAVFAPIIDATIAQSLQGDLTAIAPSTWRVFSLAQKLELAEPRTLYYLALWSCVAVARVAQSKDGAAKREWLRRAEVARSAAVGADWAGPPLQRQVELLRIEAEITAVVSGAEAAVTEVSLAAERLHLQIAADRGELSTPAVHTALVVLRLAGRTHSREFECFLDLAISLVPRQDAGPGRLLRQHLSEQVSNGVRRGAIAADRAATALEKAGLRLT